MGMLQQVLVICSIPSFFICFGEKLESLINRRDSMLKYFIWLFSEAVKETKSKGLMP